MELNQLELTSILFLDILLFKFYRTIYIFE